MPGPSTSVSMTHVQRVRYLYKAILRLHRALPPDLADLGNKYVREEFRRHKNCAPEFIRPFMVQWSQYAVDLAKQIRDLPRYNSAPSDREFRINLGKALSEPNFNEFTEAQLQQLLSLAEAIHSPAAGKPIDSSASPPQEVTSSANLDKP